MNHVVRLCSKYPGDHPVISNTTVSQEPFSFIFDDLSLSNIMIDNTGHVTRYIDFEVTAIGPLWKRAPLPEWLQVTDHNDWWLEQGGSESDRQMLLSIFMRESGYHQVGADWLEAYKKGLPIRDFSRKLAAGAFLWAYDSDRVNEWFTWAEKHPGLGYLWLDH